jgi:hypothetical protein
MSKGGFVNTNTQNLKGEQTHGTEKNRRGANRHRIRGHQATRKQIETAEPTAKGTGAQGQDEAANRARGDSGKPD